MTIREQVKAHMRRCGITQQALSDRSGILRPHIVRWLTGRRSITDPTLDKIIDALGGTISFAGNSLPHIEPSPRSDTRTSDRSAEPSDHSSSPHALPESDPGTVGTG